MNRTARFVCSVTSLLAVAAVPVPASERFVQPIGIEYATERLAAACAVATAPACAEELAGAAGEAARRLLALARAKPELAGPLAARAADSGSPALRAAAAGALGEPFATAEATPILLELLDDPVPAVRTAALRALRGSNDDTVRLVVRRAQGADPGSDAGLAVEPVPPAPKLGVALPADAVFLHFASEGFEGRLTWSTAQAPAALAGALARKGRGPFTPAQFRQEIEKMKANSEAEMESIDPGENGMPSAEQMAKAMAMAEKMMAAMEKNPDASPEQQAAALASATGQSLLEAGLAEVYTDAELFGDPKLFVVKGTDGVEVAVAVYEDRALRRTGITVHRPRGFGG
jgi:hypothetical protein